jgi:hypothetical protein
VGASEAAAEEMDAVKLLRKKPAVLESLHGLDL